MQTKQWLRSVATATAFMFALAACGGGEATTDPATGTDGPDDGDQAAVECDDTSDGPVEIGIAIPLTGGAASYGEDSQRGSDMAAAEINEAGGILDGREVELVYEDDEGSPEGGVSAVQNLMQEGVHAISGDMLSSVALAKASVTNGEILHVNMAAQADAITEEGGPWLFQINNTVSQNAEAFNSYITEELQPESIVYMGENTAFNAGVLEALSGALDEAGIEILDEAEYEADTRDFVPILNRLQDAGAEVLYVADANPARAAVLYQQISQVGGFDTILMSPGVVTEGMIEAAGTYMDGVITGEIYMPTLETPENQEFVDAFEAEYGEAPGKVELVSYEAIKVIAEAMDAVGCTTSYDAIADYMKSETFSTPRGSLGFNDMGRASAEQFYIQTIADGGLELLEEWPVN